MDKYVADVPGVMSEGGMILGAILEAGRLEGIGEEMVGSTWEGESIHQVRPPKSTVSPMLALL